MIVEFSVVPIGAGESLSEYIAEVAGIVDGSGLNYQITAMGTIVEGNWDEVMSLIKRCHDRVHEKAARVYTKITIDDRAGVSGQLKGKVASVEQKAGKTFKK
ncbi:MAG: MTH1187 family thiamine-binding protein [bacterium]